MLAFIPYYKTEKQYLIFIFVFAQNQIKYTERSMYDKKACKLSIAIKLKIK